jgi:hypothetical protein
MSGFQLDNNQITPGLYRVSINSSGFPSYSGSGAIAANAGGVNPYDWTEGSIYTGGLPSSAGYSQALSQGNMRWDRIVQALASISDCRILDVVVTTGGTSANYQPTAVNFTVAYDRDTMILPEYSKIQAAASATAGTFYSITPPTAVTGSSPTYTSYSTLAAMQAAGFSLDNVRGFQGYLGNDGATTINSPQTAIQDIVTSAICAGGTSGWSRTYRLFSVSQNGDSQTLISIQQPLTPAVVFGALTVTQISTTGIAY